MLIPVAWISRADRGRHVATRTEAGSESLQRQVGEDNSIHGRNLPPAMKLPDSQPPVPDETGGNEEEEEDSDLVPLPDVAKSFIYSTPPGPVPLSTPVVMVVTPKGSDRGFSDDDLDDESDRSVSSSDGVLDALRELQGYGGERSSLIGGVRVGNGSSLDTEKAEKKTDDEEDDSELAEKFVGPPRGFVILALMQPNARESVEKQVDTMLRSGVQNLYLGFLVDGTFGTDLEYASSVIQRLSVEGRSLTMEVYFTNGPTMRKYDETPITTPFTFMPGIFRYLITEDRDFQSLYKQLVQSIKPLFVQNRNAAAGNRNVACVMLEDNLDSSSYRRMRQLTKDVLGEAADFIRNPCPGCECEMCDSPNSTDSDGDGGESHSPDALAELGSKDALTLDGIGYNYPQEQGEGLLSFDQMKALASNAATRGIRFFGLWRADRQGLGDQLTHPDDRVYAVPTDEQSEKDIEILRSGLKAAQ